MSRGRNPSANKKIKGDDATLTIEELRQMYPDYRIISGKNQHYRYIVLEKRCVKNTTRCTLGDELKNLSMMLDGGPRP